MAFVIYFVIFLLSYLIGSFPTAYLIGRQVKKIDIREHGSKNVGATNVFRCVGKLWGSITLLLDILKGVLAVKIWPLLLPLLNLDVSLTPLLLFICGLAAVFGHNWTPFLNFKGGKGVATTLGILLGLFPYPTLITLLIAVIIIFSLRMVSPGSIVGAIVFPLFFYLFERGMEQFTFFMILICLMSLLLVWKHKKNIERLLKGQENRF